MKLMIVDDSKLMRMSIENWIVKENIELVATAANGIEALTLFEEFSPDIVTLDITMPEIDGLTVLQEIMKSKPDTKVIIVSALSDKDVALEAMTKGAASYVNKPFTQEDLLEALEEVLD